ncbi:MAG: type I-E CRISPR-associated protein Cas6/Cse3/CasE, partial [Abitibacteriaceae bacterium]|nr:type I-E CRISPR-associated protein Cas6/Cse3/CasE [Abditibacteriaceae bacterium]
YQMHRMLAKAFGDGPGEWEAARCLFRVDQRPIAIAREMEAPHLLVQSLALPHWERLTVAGDYLIGVPEIRESNPQFRAGQRLAFRLRCNPTVKRNGKRVGLYQEEERRAWLNRKAQENGFRVLHAVLREAGPQPLGEIWRDPGPTADDREPLQFRVPLKGGDRIDSTRVPNRAAFSAAQFDGGLTILDPAVFKDALCAGIGSGKAFGFGLLSLARA